MAGIAPHHVCCFFLASQIISTASRWAGFRADAMNYLPSYPLHRLRAVRAICPHLHLRVRIFESTRAAQKPHVLSATAPVRTWLNLLLLQHRSPLVGVLGARPSPIGLALVRPEAQAVLAVGDGSTLTGAGSGLSDRGER
jgi:hypothetical protein